MSEAVVVPAAQVERNAYRQCTYCVAMLQLSMMDGKKFAALHETGEDMASCELFLTPKVTWHTTPLLTALHSNLQSFVSSRLPDGQKSHAGHKQFRAGIEACVITRKLSSLWQA